MAAVLVPGCSALDAEAEIAGPEGPSALAPLRAPAQSVTQAGRHVPPACPTPTPLLVHHDSAGRVDRLHAMLTARDRRGPFLVDTGSHASFATNMGPEDLPTAETSIACTPMELPVIARLRPGKTPEGEPQAGVLGSDLVAHDFVLDLNMEKETLGWYRTAPYRAAFTPPAGAVVLPIERRHGWLVASGIRLRGRDVKLVVDTGATNVIVVDDVARPGEIREDTVDGTASPITLWHGQGALSLAGGPERHVPVDRTEDFPTLQGLLSALGGDVAGLLGMTALGRDRVILTREALYVILPPPSTPL